MILYVKKENSDEWDKVGQISQWNINIDQSIEYVSFRGEAYETPLSYGLAAELNLVLNNCSISHNNLMDFTRSTFRIDNLIFDGTLYSTTIDTTDIMEISLKITKSRNYQRTRRVERYLMPIKSIVDCLNT